MQEEVEKKTCNLAIQGLKLGFKELQKAWEKAKTKISNKIAEASEESPTGKQSVKELIGQGEGVKTTDISKTDLKAFQKTAKKYGVDFAVVRDKNSDPPTYTIFFKAKDAEAIDRAISAHAAKTFSKDKTEEKTKERPSLLKKLAKLKDIVRKSPRKEHEKRKEQTR